MMAHLKSSPFCCKIILDANTLIFPTPSKLPVSDCVKVNFEVRPNSSGLKKTVIQS